VKKKILLIEDDPIVRENTAEILTLASYSVSTAENGKTGIEKARTVKPDLIICDILMPELDGYGVLQIIMRNKSLQHIPVIFLTAKTNHEDIRKGMNLGAADYITKPFEESELLSAVEVRLKQKKMLDKQKYEKEEVLEHIRWKDLVKYFSEKERVNLKKGATVYSEGYTGSFIYYLIKGEVKTYKYNEEGKEFITRIYKTGTYFGFTSFLRNKAHYENAETLKNSILIRIPRSEFLTVIRQNPQLAYHFFDLLSLDLENVKDHLIHLAYDSVRKKTANILLKLEKEISIDGQIDISRSDLACLIGIAKETLIRTLKEFKEEETISINRKIIMITNREKLKKII
jgi:CheY-like chemotaxis protein/CRP-like cAMP-binding protein